MIGAHFGVKGQFGSQFLPSALMRQGLSFYFCHTAYSRLSSPWVSSLFCLHCPSRSTSAGIMHTWYFEWVPVTELRTQVVTLAWIVFLPTSLSHTDVHCFLFCFSLACFFFSFWDKISVSSDCPQTSCIGEDGFKCPFLLLLPSHSGWLSYYFRGKETPWSRQLIKHLIEGLLKLQSVSPWSSWQDDLGSMQAGMVLEH